MSQPEHNRWLHRFAVLTAVATMALIAIGGLVTSHEAGMAVPDWPTSYGYNMFLFPVSQWWHTGNVFYEHSHRLFASGVGLLTTILAIWLWVKERRRWVRWLGVAAFFAVVLQGVLGGLRVVLFKDQLGIFHATLAQLFFVLTCTIALFTSHWWVNRQNKPVTSEPTRTAAFRWLFIGTTALILLQLILGATMRHQHAGLAIPDFPLAYGKLWPAIDPDTIAYYNQQRVEVTTVKPITAFQIILQMTHRIAAVLILAFVAASTWLAIRKFTWHSPVARLAIVWLVLILLQAGLGVATVLTNKAADVATAHVLIGALSLATGALLSIVALRYSQIAETEPVRSTVNPGASGGQSVAPQTAAARA